MSKEDFERDLLELLQEDEKLDRENRFIQKSQAAIVAEQSEAVNEFAEKIKKKEDIVKRARSGVAKNDVVIREDGGKVWNDPTLADWPDNDYRIMVTEMNIDITDEMLLDHFKKYKSVVKARVIRDSSGRGKKYGFVSMMDVSDYIDAMKTMNNTFIGTRKIKLQPARKLKDIKK